MTARERLRKRRPKAIEIDGEKFTVRALTVGEIFELEAMQADPQRTGKIPGFVAAACLLEDDGTPLFSGPDDPGINDIPVDTLSEISDAVSRLSRTPSLAKTQKN